MVNKARKSKIYSEDLKQLVLSEVKAGISVCQVSAKYGITGAMTVYNWCKKYGIETVKREHIDIPLVFSISAEKEKSMKKETSKTTASDENKVKLLEYELALYKKLVEIAKRDYDLDLIKKLDTKQSKK